MTARKTYCDGIERRDFLRVGAAGLFGTSFASAVGLRQSAAREPANGDQQPPKPGTAREPSWFPWLSGSWSRAVSAAARSTTRAWRSGLLTSCR